MNFIIVLDLFLISLPFVSLESAEVLSPWLVGFFLISLFGSIAINEKELKSLIKETATWQIYDLTTDLLFIFAWSWYGFYFVSFVYLLNKITIFLLHQKE